MATLAFLLLFHVTNLSRTTCRISTVSYRFEGEPGSEFTYGSTRYVVPASGWVELLARSPQPSATTSGGERLALDSWPIDEFGTRHVPLPKTRTHPGERR